MTETPQSQDSRTPRTMLRLLVGGLILGSEAFQNRLQSWKGEKPQDLPEAVDAEPQSPLVFDPLPDQLPPPGLEIHSKDEISDLRYALVGLIFEGEEQLEKSLALTMRAGRFVGKIVNPLIRPIANLPNPAQKSFERLAKRGQSEVDRWVSRGREEEYQSRQFAQETAKTTVIESITYVAQTPALQELVQQQSVSLAMQILEQIRENAVSADYFFEGLARYLLRRRPRYLLPEPSPEIQSQASWRFRDSRHEDL